jgi:hypothetical protein
MWRPCFAIFQGILMNTRHPHWTSCSRASVRYVAATTGFVLHVLPLHQSRTRAYNTVGEEAMDGSAGEAGTWIICSVLQMCMCIKMAPQASGHLLTLSELPSSGKLKRGIPRRVEAKR